MAKMATLLLALIQLLYLVWLNYTNLLLLNSILICWEVTIILLHDFIFALKHYVLMQDEWRIQHYFDLSFKTRYWTMSCVHRTSESKSCRTLCSSIKDSVAAMMYVNINHCSILGTSIRLSISLRSMVLNSVIPTSTPNI
jgi:hypothetical protein